MKIKKAFVSLKHLPSWVVIGLISTYRYTISPFLGDNCRFSPSCSQYAVEAVSRFGIFKGCYLAFCRLLRCHPWCEGGIDPVPGKHGKETNSS